MVSIEDSYSGFLLSEGLTCRTSVSDLRGCVWRDSEQCSAELELNWYPKLKLWLKVEEHLSPELCCWPQADGLTHLCNKGESCPPKLTHLRYTSRRLVAGERVKQIWVLLESLHLHSSCL